MLNGLLSRLRSIPSVCGQAVYAGLLRRKLKNKDFTIICSNCIGGIIYNRLGLQFRSPTINMWMHQRDCIRLMKDLREYMNADLEFIESKYSYPVAKLKDITLYFNHCDTEEEARNDWNRRKQRINYDNLYLIIFDREDIDTDDLESLKDIPCRNIAVLSDKTRPDIPYVITIQPRNRPLGEQFLDKDTFGIRTFEKYFDYVAWLNK